jgi:hypothetical protein
MENPRLKNSRAPFVVLNSQGRSIFASNATDLAEGMADSRPGRKLLDMRGMTPQRRRLITNALRANIGPQRAESPVIPLKGPKLVRPEVDREQSKLDLIVSAIRRQVYELELDEARSDRLIAGAVYVAQMAGEEAAYDLIFEVKLTLYVQVKDLLTEEVETFDTAEEAGEYASLLNQSEDGMIRNDKGQPLRYRFKVQRPDHA